MPKNLLPDFPEWEEDIHDADYVEFIVGYGLLENAQKEFPQWVQTIRTSHSDDMRDLQTKINASREGGNFRNKQVLVMDLDKFVVGLGLRISDSSVFKTLLQNEGVTLSEMDVPFKCGPISQKHELSSPINYNKHVNGVNFFPHASSMIYFKEGDKTVVNKDVGYITPMLDYSYSSDKFFKNMTHKQVRLHTKFHEAMHAMDDTFLIPIQDVIDKTWSGNIVYRPDARKIIEDEEYKQITLRTLLGEGFADIGSSGEMIRQGETLDIIDKMCDVRKEGEFGYATGVMLQGFKSDILAMGEDAFRAMEEKDAIDFYRKTVRKHGLTSEQLVLAAKIGWVEADPAQAPQEIVDEIRNLDASNPDVKKAQHYVRHFNQPREDSSGLKNLTENPYGPVLNPVQHKEKVEMLLQMNAKELLCNRAFELGGKITPQTVAGAFLTCLEDMRAERENGGDAEMLNAKMIKLQSSFVYDTIEYVEENQARGVDILRESYLNLTEEEIATGRRIVAKEKFGL